MMTDAAERRATPLALRLADEIRRNGPICVAAYIRACLLDEAHGYYRRPTAIGRDGDFITAPEISQVFGELVGLWCAVVWQQMGKPGRVQFVELGPGRGTLMRDALRAVRVMPEFLAAADVALVEASPVLTAEQRVLLSSMHARLAWYEDLSLIPEGAAIIIGNEFLDTLPVHQWVCTPDGWRERAVGVNAVGALEFATSGHAPESLPACTAGAKPGDIFEQRQTAFLTSELLRRSRHAPIAALFIDYGHPTSAIGDTLQAVRGHAYEDPLASPGEADLTTQVDFESFVIEARAAGLASDGPVTQAEWLGALGLAERTSRLMAANPERAGVLELGAARLMQPTGMGSRFKVVALRSPTLATLPGFPAWT